MPTSRQAGIGLPIVRHARHQFIIVALSFTLISGTDGPCPTNESRNPTGVSRKPVPICTCGKVFGTIAV